MRLGSVGGRVGVVGVALTLVAALCLIAWSTAARVQRLDADLHRAGADSARDFAALALPSMRLADAPALQTLARSIAAAPAVRSATILDGQDRPVARAGIAPARAPMGPPLGETPVDSDSLLVHAPLVDRHPDRGEPAAGAGAGRSANTLGWVQLELSRTATRRAQTQILAQGLGAALLSALIAGVLASRLGRGARESSHVTAGGQAASPRAAAARLEKALYRERLRSVELERERRRAAAASRVTSTFLASISHEIRTPMSSVLGYCNLLLQTRLNPAQTEFANTIKTCTESLLGLVDGILDTSRTQARVYRLETTELDLRECVEDVLTLLAPSAYEKNLELACLVSPYVPLRVRGNADGMRHVLINLISNAVKYTEHGSVVVRVTLTGEDGGGLTTLFSVTDTGPGIDEHCRRGLFKAFNRPESGALYAGGGNGLGLAICKDIVDSLGGEIGVESTPGRGSTFWFTVHCEKCKSSPARTVKALDGRRALVYGRGAFTCSALREMLTSWGMQVDEARTLGKLAAQVEAREGRSPVHDVVILDLSGHRRQAAVVNDVRAGCDAPVVAIRNVAEHEAAWRLGPAVNACLLKPVRYHELQATLERLIGVRTCGDVEAAPAAVREEPEAAPSALRVLLADDDEACRRLLVLLLRAGGVRVSLAYDGHQAVTRTLEGRFDLVLMDLYMPGLDGAAAAQRIRAAEQTGQHTPIIALTADPGRETRRRLLESGVDDCLVKPVSEAELWQKIHGHARHERIFDAFAGDPPSPRATPEQELRSLLLAELPARRRRISEALERADTATIGFEAHALAGAAAYCAVPALKQASEALKRAADFGRMSAVARRVRRLNVEMDALLSAGRRISSAAPGTDNRLAGSAHPNR